MNDFDVEARAAFETALGVLEARGVLLEADAVLPSLVGLVVGGSVRGSWWGHPKGHVIHMAGQRLAKHPDVLLTKLVNGKLTYVERRLWPALLAAALEPDARQTEGLSLSSRSLLEEVRAAGCLTLASPADPSARRARQADARRLEARALVLGREMHTPSGVHAKELMTWECWAQLHGVSPPINFDADRGRCEIRRAVAELARSSGGSATLPWAASSRGVA